MNQILITCFDDYEKSGIQVINNPSKRIAYYFLEKNALFKNHAVNILVLDPNNQDASSKLIVENIENGGYDVVIALGLKTLGTEALILESRAYSEEDDIYFDNNAPFNLIEQELKNNSIEYTMSCDAGNGSCNNIYRVLLEYISVKHLNTKALFIHLPLLDNTTILGKERTATMPIEKINAAIEIILNILI